jgi:hypothetical protein
LRLEYGIDVTCKVGSRLGQGKDLTEEGHVRGRHDCLEGRNGLDMRALYRKGLQEWCTGKVWVGC